MSKTGGLRIKSLSELVEVKEKTTDVVFNENVCEKSATIQKDIESDGSGVEFVSVTTPVKGKKTKRATTTSKKLKLETQKNPAVNLATTAEAVAATTTKKLPKTAKKELPPDQTKIDSFFKSCSKTYVIEKLPSSTKTGNENENSQQGSSKKKKTTTSRKRNNKTTPRKRGKGRKRLFDDTTSETTTSMSNFSEKVAPRGNRKRKSLLKNDQTSKEKQRKQVLEVTACIDLCSESEEELGVIVKAESLDINDENVPMIQKFSQLADTQAKTTSCTKENEVTALDLCAEIEEQLEVIVKAEFNDNNVDIVTVIERSSQPVDTKVKTTSCTKENEVTSLELSSEIKEVFDVIVRAESNDNNQDNVTVIAHPSQPADNKVKTTSCTKEKEETPWDLCSEIEEVFDVIVRAESNDNNEDNVTVIEHSSHSADNKAESTSCTKENKEETSSEKSKEFVGSSMVSIHLHGSVHLKIPSPPTSDATSAENFQTNIAPVKSYYHLPIRTNGNSFENKNEDAKEWNGPRRKVRTCPPYKVVDGTTFAVDGFQFGPIKGVTHYFLSHFHMDHYVGLTRKFSMPLYLSAITARLLQVFIPIDEKFLRIMELNDPQLINGVEVTAIDANHCPGAIMFIFKLSTGKCILHTGDFRASPNMESEPIFWNNNIDNIYLDTTYISNKYAFCTQDESIAEAQRLIEEFQEKHRGKKILYICGAYLIGKERFWSALARKNKLSVWTEPKREKALHAMNELNIIGLLNKNPKYANMHVITMGKLSYFSLVEYFEPYSTVFDLCLAIRPSGWEKNSKPQYRGKINIIGIEYSEHSSYKEMQRFVTYLKPKAVISTVPASHDLMITSKVPLGWYKYDKFPGHKGNWQPSITSYLKLKRPNNEQNKKNEKNSKENITKTCTPPPPQCLQSQDNTDSPKISPNNLSLKVGYDADDDWLS